MQYNRYKSTNIYGELSVLDPIISYAGMTGANFKCAGNVQLYGSSIIIGTSTSTTVINGDISANIHGYSGATGSAGGSGFRGERVLAGRLDLREALDTLG